MDFTNTNPHPVSDADLDGLIKALDAREHMDKYIQPYTYERGPKFARIVQKSAGSRSCFCFIEMATGNILKSAGWKAPEKKHPRGHIWTEGHGVEFLGPYGAHYLR